MSTPPTVFTIEEFCEAHRISRTKLYGLWNAGIGPRFMRIGTKVLITNEAAADWRREREAAANTQPVDKNSPVTTAP